MHDIRSRKPLAGDLLLVVLAFLLAASLLAEDTFPLRAIQFEGNQHFATEGLLEASGLQLGEQVRKRDFDLALRKLNATGVFEQLRYRFGPFSDGYSLTFSVAETVELYPVRFEGFGTEDAVLNAMLQDVVPLYTDHAPLGGQMTATLVNALQGWWLSQGHEEEIEHKLVPVSEGQFEMLINPWKATNNISFVKFSNTGQVEMTELQRTFNQAARGEAYSEARFKELLHYNARPLYTEYGYMNVIFCPCETSKDPDSEGLLVDVHVEQGEVYLFGEVSWPQPMPVDPDSLAKVNRIVPGEVANMKAAYDTMAAVSEGMKQHGYMKAQATFEERVDHDARQVNLDIQIAPGTLYVFSRLIIEGLDILSEPAIRKRWGMQSGDPFDIRYPAYFLNRVKSEAMLENLMRTDWRFNANESSGRVDVTLVFYGKSESEEK